MAQKLHDQYGFSYDNLKVLLGGWNAWKTAGYPTESTTPPTSAPSGQTDTGGLTNAVPLTGGVPIVLTP